MEKRVNGFSKMFMKFQARPQNNYLDSSTVIHARQDYFTVSHLGAAVCLLVI